MEIKDFRREIDAADDRIIELINRRAEIGLKVGELKRLQGRPIRSPDREAEVLERMATLAGGPLSADAIRRIFSQIIEETRTLEESNSDL
jgi:chorismate mutase-like protein